MTGIDEIVRVFGSDTSLAQVEVPRRDSAHRWRRQILSASLLLILGLAASRTLFAQASPPDTPAGRTLRAFLNAFNSDDLASLQAYVKQYGSPQPADGLQAFSAQTGGFDLVSIRTSTPDSITFMVKGRGDHLNAFGNLRLASTEPPKVKSIIIQPCSLASHSTRFCSRRRSARLQSGQSVSASPSTTCTPT